MCFFFIILIEETPAEEQEVKELANGNCDIKAPVDEISEVQTEESLDDAVEHSTGVSEYSEQEPAVCADEKAEEPTAVEKNEELINEPKHDDYEIINSVKTSSKTASLFVIELNK